MIGFRRFRHWRRTAMSLAGFAFLIAAMPRPTAAAEGGPVSDDTRLEPGGGGSARVPMAAEETDLVFHYTRLELDAGVSNRGQAVGNWVGNGWLGTDYNKIWMKTKGEVTAGTLDDGDLQIQYSRYIAPFWDLQAGYRREFKPSQANQAVISLQGIAPYWFETDAELFLGGPSTVGGRLRVEHDFIWTQRLITRPEVTVDWGVGNDPRNAVGKGLQRVELELQTRYEITRDFAPYFSARYERQVGQTSLFVHSKGESPEAFIFSLGLWLVF
jgi:copper resistance protein B